MREVKDTIGTTYAAANSLVARLVEHGILEALTGQRRNRVFEYVDYVRLFVDDA